MRKRISEIIFFCILVWLGFLLYEKAFLIEKKNTIPQKTVTNTVKLTDKEQQWLNAHPSIRIAFDGNFPPYSFINESGEMGGISFDILQLISKKLNIQLKIDKRSQWKEIYQAALNKEVDVIATMVNRPEREFQFLFTRPYVFKSLVIVAHNSNKELKQRSQLGGKTIALIKGYQYSETILKEFPTITPFYVDTIQDALEAVETQQVDAAISYFAATYFIQNKYLLSHIKVVAFYDRNSANESIAILKGQPVLAGIFQKALESISESEVQFINSQWYPPIKKPIDYETIRQIVGVFVAILIVLAIWVGQIKYQSRKLKITKNKLLSSNHELNTLKDSLEIKVVQRTQQLKQSEQKYRSLVENLRDEYFFYKHNVDGEFIYLSPSFTKVFGYDIEYGMKHYSSFLSDHEDNKRVKEYTDLAIKGGESPAYEIEIIDKNGDKHRLEIFETPFYDEQGSCIGIEGLAHDITETKQIQERLNWLSYYDDLTGLANRRLFKEKLEQLITLSKRHKQPMALLFLDLDKFKMINDSLGHAVGDYALKETANRLKNELRDSDVSARMGGDEFTLILPNTDAEAAEKVAHKVIASLLAPYILEGNEFILGASIGIAIYPQHSTNANELVQLADIAMYQAKKTKGGYALHASDTMSEK